jgi:hypothetical protein
MVQNNLPLIHALIDAFLFLENATDNEVDPDSAVRCMENMAASLLALENSDQLALRSHLMTIADESEDSSYRNFVRNLPDSIGLASAQAG